jgi:hypothetical protein
MKKKSQCRRKGNNLRGRYLVVTATPENVAIITVIAVIIRWMANTY